MKILAFILGFLVAFINCNGQVEISDTMIGNARIATITRIKAGEKVPKIDGAGDERIWDEAIFFKGFTLMENRPGEPCSKETRFKLLYDDNAIYIYAEMEDSPGNILKELAQRDNYNNTDYIELVFDPYASGTIGYGFGVTPRNLQRDVKYIGQEEDESWDAIWDSSVRLTDDGWQAEIRIPFSQLRFPEDGTKNWRFNVFRQMMKSRELSAWQAVNPAISGVLNQSGYLSGIADVKAPLRLSLFPYLAGYYGPKASKKFRMSGGLDLKYGLNDAYTLDLTLVPDFGQVSFDDNIYNLGPFEVQYEERRPFFTEGLELFSRAELFYSRRIGAQNSYFDENEVPAGKVVEDYPKKNKLINAFKLTGRGKNGLAVGVFNATEGKGYAKLLDTLSGQHERLLINPLSNYNIIVLDQNLKNNSYISIINTNVARQGSFRDANVIGTDLNIRNKNQTYYIQANGALSLVRDRGDHSVGYKYYIDLGKNSGNWTYSLEHEEVSKKFDPRDLGFLSEFNFRKTELKGGYSTYIPRGIRNKSTTSLELEYIRIINPDRFANFSIELEYFFLERNFNAINIDVKTEPVVTYDYFEPRTPDFSRYYLYPKNFTISGFISTDYRKAVALDMNYLWEKWDEPGRKKHEVMANPRFRLNDYFSVKCEVGYTRWQNDVGYAFTEKVGDNGLQPGDIIFSNRDITTIELGLNPTLLINPNLSISARVRNYWSKIHNESYHLLKQNGHLAEQAVSTDNVPEFLVVQFTNFEARATWRFAGGSDLILAWDSGYNDVVRNDSAYRDFFNRFGDKIRNNLFSVRINYFLDYERIFVKGREG